MLELFLFAVFRSCEACNSWLLLLHCLDCDIHIE